MDFKEALLKVGEMSLEVYNMIDPFFLYSHLSDYSRSTLEKKLTVKKYYNILQRVNFYEFLLLNGIIDGKEMIIQRYDKVSTVVTFEEYLFFLDVTVTTILQTDYLYDYMQSNLSRKTVYPYIEKTLPADTIYYKKNRCEYIHLDPQCIELEKTKTIYQKILPRECKMKVCKRCADANICQRQGQEHQFLKLVDALFKTDYNTTKITKSKKNVL